MHACNVCASLCLSVCVYRVVWMIACLCVSVWIAVYPYLQYLLSYVLIFTETYMHTQEHMKIFSYTCWHIDWPTHAQSVFPMNLHNPVTVYIYLNIFGSQNFPSDNFDIPRLPGSLYIQKHWISQKVNPASLFSPLPRIYDTGQGWKMKEDIT